MPFTMARSKDHKIKEPTVGGYINVKKIKDMNFDKDPTLSAIGGMSAI